jgi:hypothetical protein
MVTKQLSYIYLDEGEFLYDQVSRKIYTFIAPHRCIGHLSKSFEIVFKKERV